MRIICNKENCTGCGACKDICPKKCISMRPDDLDALYPHIDESLCINCGLCEKTCPNNINLEFHSTQKVWAAWSNNDDIRRTSASGGIAYELYRYWLEQGGVAVGVTYDREKGCNFVLLENEEDIKFIQNSKYTFSNTNGVYQVLKQRLESKIPALFIGVPCQVAGLYGYLKKTYDHLTTVDIICHGMPPSEYLEQHISSIERNKKEKTANLSFRDARYKTSKFIFTLSNSIDSVFYKKKVRSWDNFQLGYHHALIYRDNCYRCKYAKHERIADLTIGDFSGLGKYASFNFERINVSCILENSEKGKMLLDSIKRNIFLNERPASEAYDFEKQLNLPSKQHPQRDIFERKYKQTKSFSKAANSALYLDKWHVFIRKGLWKDYFRNLFYPIVPKRFLKSVKLIIR